MLCLGFLLIPRLIFQAQNTVRHLALKRGETKLSVTPLPKHTFFGIRTFEGLSFLIAGPRIIAEAYSKVSLSVVTVRFSIITNACN